jgi:hypothetical protein
MPVVINEMNSRFDVRDESKLKKLIAKEVKACLEAEKTKGRSGGGPDPSDPSASGRPGEGGG